MTYETEIELFPKQKYTVDNNFCFVLMPFDQKSTSFYNQIIRPTIENELKLNVKKGDDIFGTNAVIHDIWEYINKAKFLIAVLNGRNPNVFYEIGLSHAIKKRVVLITNNKEDVPYDLRYLRYIYYKDDEIDKFKIELIGTLNQIKNEDTSVEISTYNKKTLELLLANTVKSLYHEQLENNIEYRAYIMLYNEKKETLKTKVYYNMEGHKDKNLEIQIDKSSAGQAFTNRQIEKWEKGYDHNVPQKISNKIKSMISIPIISPYSDKPIGVFNIDSDHKIEKSKINKRHKILRIQAEIIGRILEQI